MHALIVDGSPEPSSLELVERLVRASDYVIAADRGAVLLHELGIVPDVFCGDDDSADGASSAWAHEGVRTDIRYPSEKYATDLALAIDCARHEAARREARLELSVTCATGGRLDHQLAVVGLLAQHVDALPRLVEDGYECRFLSPLGRDVWEVGKDAQVGATFSVLALREGTVVSERGMRWELDHHELALLEDRGVSNIVASADALVTCEEGIVAAYLLRS